MKSFPVAVASLAVVIAVGTWVDVRGQAPAPAPRPVGPAGASAPTPYTAQGEGVFPAFEGWGPHTDGTNTILIGYFNRNRDQMVDVPIGPNNHMDPGGPDLGQPTHFEPGRAYGVFSLQVPKDFGSKKIAWTLNANGQSTTVQFSLNPPYWVDFFENHATGNTPPTWRLAKDGPVLSGPPKGYVT
ncbi:MAG: hypothetical protein LBQ09_11320, partial [Acidobacteriaceae bacterium]|nr:hypothetical protein [Acidobacteriaceae bacterium]